MVAFCFFVNLAHYRIIAWHHILSVGNVDVFGLISVFNLTDTPEQDAIGLFV